MCSSDLGQVKGICGSAIIDGVAELFRTGIVDSRGKFKKGLDSKRIREGESGWEYVIAWAEETSIGREVSARIRFRDLAQVWAEQDRQATLPLRVPHRPK